MSWIAVAPPLLAALAVILVPGLVATAPLRTGLTARVALSGVVGVAALGAAGIASGLLGAPFAAWQPLVPGAVLGVLAYLIRRRWPRLALPPDRVRAGWLVLAWIGAAALIGVVAFALVPEPDRISQTYDNVFHLSAIAHLLQTGDASSLTLRTLIETDRTWAFYPAAWHSLVAAAVQLTGAGVPVAVNGAWLAVCAAIWLPGAAWLAQVLVRRAAAGVVTLVALPLGAAFGAMPYALLSWGTLYPTFLAGALLPAAVAVPVATWRRRRAARRDDRTAVWILGLAGTLVAVAAIGVAQPRVLATWALLLVPFVVAVAVSSFRRAWHAGGPTRRRAVGIVAAAVAVVALAAAAAFAYAVLRLGLLDRPLDDRLGGPQARASQPVWEGLVQALAQSWPTGVAGVIAWPALLLAAALVVGAVVALRTRGLRWVVAAYALIAVLFALAAGSDDVVTKLATALWYKDRFRLSSALPVVGVALAALGVLATASWAARSATLRRRIAVALAWLVALTSAVVLAVSGVSASIATVFRLPESDAGTAIVSRAQIDFLGRLGEYVPADQRVLGDPWDGSALSLLFGGREPVFPHVNGQWDADRRVLAARLQDVDTDPAVCTALDDLRVRYVLYSPHELAGGDPAGNLFAAVHRAVEAGLFARVATDGDTSLYRIDQCGALSPSSPSS